MSQQFIQRVREMRAAQKRYFKDRSGEALSQSKQLEKLVDRLLAEMDEPQPLFSDAPDRRCTVAELRTVLAPLPGELPLVATCIWLDRPRDVVNASLLCEEGRPSEVHLQLDRM